MFERVFYHIWFLRSWLAAQCRGLVHFLQTSCSQIAQALRFVCGSWSALYFSVHLRNSSNWFHLHCNSFGVFTSVIYFVVYAPLCMSSAHTLWASCESTYTYIFTYSFFLYIFLTLTKLYFVKILLNWN